MNPVPDIIVLDFCEWLKREFRKSEDQGLLSLDIIMGNGNYRFSLTEYAQKFLKQRRTQTECTFKNTMKMFLDSDELNQVLQECCHWHKERWCCDCYNLKYLDYCLHCPEIRDAFHHFIKNHRVRSCDEDLQEITAEHLAEYTRWLLLYGNDDDVRNQPVLFSLMSNSSLELSEELNFFDWLEKQIEFATDIRKMPSAVFEEYVDNYIKESGKTEADKKRILRAYQKTGWEELFEKFQVLFRIRKHKNKSLSETIDRYYSHYGIYNCIILPLSDENSQHTYNALITESWEDLNSCSGNYLDIYYSEKDTGKSGFDIANRINSLPDRLKLKAPCLIVWKQSMKESEDISISGLDNIQIVELIKSIVESIRCEKEFKQIIEEAHKKVKELKEEKKNISNYYAPVITGDNNVVGDNNTVGTGNISGNSNTVTGNMVNHSVSEKQIIEDFEKAISAIKKSDELNEDMKKQLADIFETAKIGISEQSEEKQDGAKKAFKYVKSFLTKVAPFLVENLANIATIAAFFGLTL